MSEFQLGLLGIGVVVVLAVIAFNKWQEVRYRRQSEAALNPKSADVLMEPDMAGSLPAGEDDLPREPTLTEPAGEVRPATPVPPPARARPAPTFSTTAIDLVVGLESESGLALQDFNAGSLDEGVTRRIGLETLVEGKWEALREDARYPAVKVHLQLVNRKGPVSEQDLQQFAGWIGELASRTGATHAPLDLAAARQNAIALDGFCGEVDILIAVHVIAAANPFPRTRIRALSEAAGLVIENGIFRKRDDEGRELFRLANEGGALFQADTMRELATPSVVLEFDVARSPGGNHAFMKFRQFAEHLASGLSGKLVDDNRKPLGAAGFDAISRELSGVYQSMAARGISPGSPESLRLFS